MTIIAIIELFKFINIVIFVLDRLVLRNVDEHVQTERKHVCYRIRWRRAAFREIHRMRIFDRIVIT